MLLTFVGAMPVHTVHAATGAAAGRPRRQARRQGEGQARRVGSGAAGPCAGLGGIRERRLFTSRRRGGGNRDTGRSRRRMSLRRGSSLRGRQGVESGSSRGGRGGGGRRRESRGPRGPRRLARQLLLPPLVWRDIGARGGRRGWGARPRQDCWAAHAVGHQRQ